MKLRLLISLCLAGTLLVPRVRTYAADASPTPETTNARELKLSIPANGASMPMLSFGGRPGVNVRINGQGPFPFVVDTGAGQTVIDASLVSQLSLPPSGGSATIEELGISEASLRDVSVMAGPVMRMPGQRESPRGVLSALSFPGYLLTFDFPRKQITIRRGTLGEPNDKTIFSYEPSDDFPTVPVRISGREIWVHLDTGAPMALALPTKYKDLIPLDGTLREGAKARTPSGEFPIFKGSIKGDIEVGTFKLPGHEVFFTDAVPYPNATPRGQVGSAGLGAFAVTLDASNRRIEFSK